MNLKYCLNEELHVLNDKHHGLYKKSIFYALNGKLNGWNDKHLGLDKKKSGLEEKKIPWLKW